MTAPLTREERDEMRRQFGCLCESPYDHEQGCPAREFADVHRLLDDLDAKDAEIERLRDLLDRDRTGLAAALNAIRVVTRGYGWIPSGELGCYTSPGCGEGGELTEKALRAECGRLIDEVTRIASDGLAKSATLATAAFSPEVTPPNDAAELASLRAEVRVYRQALVNITGTEMDGTPWQDEAQRALDEVERRKAPAAAPDTEASS